MLHSAAVLVCNMFKTPQTQHMSVTPMTTAKFKQTSYNVRYYEGGLLGISTFMHPREEDYHIKPLTEWARIWNVPVPVLAKRVLQGWPYGGLKLPADKGWIFEAKMNGLTLDGKHRSLEQWAESCGIGVEALIRRLMTRVKGPDDVDGLRAALTTPNEHNAARFYYMGKLGSLREHAREHGINYNTLRLRVAGRFANGKRTPGMKPADALAIGRRKPRSDRSVPNPRRSSRLWES